MAKTSKTSSSKTRAAAPRPEKPRQKAAAPAKSGGTAFEPGSRITFTINQVPSRPAQQKTIQRLMRMQPEIQRGLKRLSIRRQRDVNTWKQRGGRMWANRARATKLAYVGEGETFSLLITPQIIPDLRSVEKFLTVSKS
jgi:hypothetical protein